MAIMKETASKKVGKASCQNRRCGGDGSAKHNDRTTTMKHMDKSKIHLDTSYMRIDGEWCPCFQGEGELANYEKGKYHELFDDYVSYQKKKYLDNYQPQQADKLTIESLYNKKQTCPDEILVQVFDKGKYKDRQKFEQMVQKQIEKLENENFVVLSYSIHESETSMHAHIRGVWLYKNKVGILEPKQDRALEQMGFSLPNPNEKKSRFNNRKQPWTEKEMQMWYDTVEEIDKTVKIDRTPKKRPKKEKKAQIDHEEGLLERLKAEVKKVLDSSEKEEFEALKSFVRDKGLMNEFKQFYNEFYLEKKANKTLKRQIEETIEDIEFEL